MNTPLPTDGFLVEAVSQKVPNTDLEKVAAMLHLSEEDTQKHVKNFIKNGKTQFVFSPEAVRKIFDFYKDQCGSDSISWLAGVTVQQIRNMARAHLAQVRPVENRRMKRVGIKRRR